MSHYQIGEIICMDTDIEINKGRETISLIVNNMGDRPVQVGSHFHFFEVNKYLKFNRSLAFGYHLDIPSGTAIRFEPGEEKEVSLVVYAGDRIICGFNGLTMGSADDEQIKSNAMEKAHQLGFMEE